MRFAPQACEPVTWTTEVSVIRISNLGRAQFLAGSPNRGVCAQISHEFGLGSGYESVRHETLAVHFMKAAEVRFVGRGSDRSDLGMVIWEGVYDARDVNREHFHYEKSEEWTSGPMSRPHNMRSLFEGFGIGGCIKVLFQAPDRRNYACVSSENGMRNPSLGQVPGL